MRRMMVCLAFVFGIGFTSHAGDDYIWLSGGQQTRPIAEAIETPDGYQRISVVSDSYADWLRHLPVKPGSPPVRLCDGRLKGNQAAHHAVLHIDVGNRDLQQCADAIIRLRAEYLFSRGAVDAIGFHFTDGTYVPYRRWRRGERPIVTGHRVVWSASGGVDDSYAGFRVYLTTIFIYAGTLSLARDVTPVASLAEIRIGDFFLERGSPGHAVLVIDMARHSDTGERLFLLAQSYMPAQDIHILRNTEDRLRSPWYAIPEDGVLVTPEWTFAPGSLVRFDRKIPTMDAP